MAADLMSMMDNFWEEPRITQEAFRPRTIKPQYAGATSGTIRDGTFDVPGGDKIAYRLYLNPSVPAQDVDVTVICFHGNAEVCTDMDEFASVFHKSRAALLSIDYRGFAWGSGQPSLYKLCDDAEVCFDSSQKILEAAGLGSAVLVVMGRSIGAACAVHLAAKRADTVRGLIVDSGLMSLKRLPNMTFILKTEGVDKYGPQVVPFIPMIPEPFDTIGKLGQIRCATVVMHGDLDEIVPVQQAVECHEKCAAGEKKFRRFEGAGHNDVRLKFQSEWVCEVTRIIELAKAQQHASVATMDGVGAKLLAEKVMGTQAGGYS